MESNTPTPSPTSQPFSYSSKSIWRTPTDHYARIFKTAPGWDISRTAYKLTDLVLPSSDITRSIIGAAAMLYKTATYDIEYSRTVSLIAQSIWRILKGEEDPWAASMFKKEMECMTESAFSKIWMVRNF